MQILSYIRHSVIAYIELYNVKPVATKNCTVQPNCTKKLLPVLLVVVVNTWLIPKPGLKLDIFSSQKEN